MIKTLRNWFLSSLPLVLFCGSVFAQIEVSRSVIEFSADGKIQDIEVMNTGDFKIYLDMKVAEIVNPAADNPTRVELDDPRTAAVLVSPRQLLIPPGQRKRVRVILREPADTSDKVYRLAIRPYTGKLKLGTSPDKKKTSAIKVLVGYDLLLLSRPQNINPKLDVIRTSDVIKFSNNGNTNVLLRKITQCDQTKSDCVDLEANRLYAGETYEVELPKKGDAKKYPVEVYQSVGLDNSLDTY